MVVEIETLCPRQLCVARSWLWGRGCISAPGQQKSPLGPKPGGDDVDWEVTLWALRGGAEFESRIR